tara:strand:- start:804 stop:932 length:129 start_codon:yes stop_codon:yes gene_type:complete
MAKNDTKGGSAPKDSNLIPMHKRLAMGQKPDTGAGSGKKTPA